MCTYSMAIDHFGPRFPDWVKPAQPEPVSITFTPDKDAQILAELAEIKQLIKDFKAALEAAKTFDKLTQQPDCEDPQKAKLVGRVEELEKRIKTLEQRKRRAKRRG